MPQKKGITENERMVFLAIKAILNNATGASIENFLIENDFPIPRSSVYAAIIGLQEKGYIKSGKSLDGRETYSPKPDGDIKIGEWVKSIRRIIEITQMLYANFIKYFTR